MNSEGSSRIASTEVGLIQARFEVCKFQLMSVKRRRVESWDTDGSDVDVLVSTSSGQDEDMYCYKLSMRKLIVSLLSNELGLERVTADSDDDEEKVCIKISVRTKRESPESSSDAIPTSPRREFTRKAPKLSRVASKVQTFIRRSLGLSDFLVDIQTQDD